MAGMYPTGVSPVAFDMDNTMRAVTQQMVKFRQNELQEKKGQVDQNELAILKALDFDTVKGVSDKWALEHTNNIKNLTDKWAQRYKERGGILSAQDKLELVRDKRDVEQKMANAASDVAYVAKIQEMILDPKLNTVIDKNATQADLVSYINSDKFGSGGAASIVKTLPPVFGSEFMSEYEPYLKYRSTCKDCFTESPTADPKTGLVTTKRSNRQSIDSAIDFITSQPKFLQLAQQDPAKAEMLKEQLRNKYLTESESGKYVASMKDKTGEQKFSDKDFPMLESAKEVEGAKLFNDWAERVWRGDDSALRTLKGNTWDTVKITKKNIILQKQGTPTATNPEGALTEKKIPRSISKKDFKNLMWDYAPESMRQGLEKAPVGTFIKEEWETGSVTPMELFEITEFKDSVAELKNKLEGVKTGSKITVDDIIEKVKAIYPDANIKRISSHAIEFNGKAYELDPSKDDDFKSNKSKELKSTKFINDILKSANAGSGGADDDDVKAQLQSKLDSIGYDALVKEYVDQYGKAEEEVKKVLLDKYGIADPKYQFQPKSFTEEVKIPFKRNG